MNRHADALGEALGEALVQDELADMSADEIRARAADYLRLRMALQVTMYDLRDWDGTDPARELDGLSRYVEHLTGGHHGGCTVCGRLVSAAHPFVELPRGRVWHPKVLWRAAVRLYQVVRYGTYQIAHTRCTRAGA